MILAHFTLTPGPKDLTQTVAALLTAYQDSDTYAYERNGTWYLGLGSAVSMGINADGTECSTTKDGKEETHAVNEPLADIARKFMSEHSTADHVVFGQVGFNYAAHIRGQTYTPGQWPLLSLMVPRVRVRLDRDSVEVNGSDEREVEDLRALLKSGVDIARAVRSQSVDTMDFSGQYTAQVERALAEMQAGLYTKVILSRIVELTDSVDIPATLLCGRGANIPARTFSLNHAGFRAMGFSPELVMSVQDGMVSTEPLAGTRSRMGTAEEIERLKRELVRDPKEIVEHVISVKEAIAELQRICPADSVKVDDFMLVKARGSVQHLGSRVSGCLERNKDAWDALGELFPSITATGIPKDAALEAIQRLESRPRELYSGAVLMLEGSDTMEAALVLRSVFQDKSRRWIQAGAGVISQSNAERELTETREKLGSIAPFVMAGV
ncbi:ADC synthase [Aspergillus coremiiformis]|uniref:ADC synthase n=1 Tax=Aspergillus coremiiformis TaxID=138285 RepID=A0A5N6Z8F5_9EURO|nr:ADC synthase [Aspergillus coremiiformis]